MPDVNTQSTSSSAEESSKQRHQMAVSAGFMAMGTGTSRILGFLRDMLAAAYFSRLATDVWVVAFRIPNLFRRILGEGALSVSFIPVLTDFYKRQDEEGARRFASQIFTLLLIVLTVITVLGTIFAPEIVNVIAEGFSETPGKLELTIHQTRIMFSFILLISLYAYAMAILNTLRKFWLPAVAPALWNLTMIGFIIFGRQSLNEDALAWGTIVGAVLQLGLLVPTIYKNGYGPRFVKFWNDDSVVRVLKSMGPSMLGLSVLQLGVLINTHFAARLGEGANSYIFFADRILELPLSMFAVSLGTVALPTLSALWSRGDKDGMTSASLHALKLVLFVSIPSAIGIYFLSYPIIETLFKHGKFTEQDTIQTANVLRIYGLGLIISACVRVIAPAFYAMKNTWLPAVAAALALLAHVFIASYLMELWGIEGLAASSVCSAAINLLVLVIAYQYLVKRFPWRDLTGSFAKFTLAGILLGAATLSYNPLRGILGEALLMRAFSLGITILLASLVYFGTSYLLQVPELTEAVDMFGGKIRRKFGRGKKK